MTNKKFQTGNVLIISITHFIHDVYSSFLAPILPLLIEKFSLTYTQAGLLTIFQRIPSLLNPIVGIMADKVGVKLLVIFSPAITVVVMSLLGIAPTYSILAVLLLVMGIAASMFHVPAPVMIKQIAGERIGKGMSFFMLGGELARSVGPLVVLGGISLWGLEGIYKLIPFGLTASLILYFKFRNLDLPKLVENHESKKIYKVLKEFRSLFIMVLGILFFTSVIKGTLTTFLTVYLTNQGESLWYAGGALSIFQLAGAGGTFFSGSVSDKIGRRKILLFSAIINPVLLFLFVFTSGIISFILILLLGFFLFSFTPVLLAIVNESKTVFPTFLNGIFMTINFITSALAVALIGYSADYISLESTYIVSSLMGLATIPFVLKVKS